ncbi:hypothetical protein NFI96_016921, partial [Prochilodus magdalenae]
WKNHHMRTVTNYFIVNLSFADILVTITCLPASLVVDITETWFFGETLCRILPYLQRPVGQHPVDSVLWAAPCGQLPVPPDKDLEDDQHCTVQQQMSYLLCLSIYKVEQQEKQMDYSLDLYTYRVSCMTISVSVSVLTLSCIAQDRWYAICHPLKFKSTAKRARKSIVLIWLVSCVIMIPQAIVMECSSLLPELLPELTNKTSLFTVCDEHWGDEIYPKVYHTCFFIVTYFAPLCLMVLAYIQICHKLWCQQIPGTSSVLQRKWKSLQCSAQATGPGESVKVRTSAVSAEIKQVKARRKTARMLMVVLFVFALCYLPISVLNIMKRVFGAFKNTNNRETVYAWFTFSHWLIYANSAANPIIYNFLSGKFREEFKAAFSCHCSGGVEKKERVRAKMSTDSHKSLTTQVSHFDNVSRISDQVV